jgi:hypothetical protein
MSLVGETRRYWQWPPADINAPIRAVRIGKDRSVAHQATGCSELVHLANRWHVVAEREYGELFDRGTRRLPPVMTIPDA